MYTSYPPLDWKAYLVLVISCTKAEATFLSVLYQPQVSSIVQRSLLTPFCPRVYLPLWDQTFVRSGMEFLFWPYTKHRHIKASPRFQVVLQLIVLSARHRSSSFRWRWYLTTTGSLSLGFYKARTTQDSNHSTPLADTVHAIFMLSLRREIFH